MYYYLLTARRNCFITIVIIKRSHRCIIPWTLNGVLVGSTVFTDGTLRSLYANDSTVRKNITSAFASMNLLPSKLQLILEPLYFDYYNLTARRNCCITIVIIITLWSQNWHHGATISLRSFWLSFYDLRIGITSQLYVLTVIIIFGRHVAIIIR